MDPNGPVRLTAVALIASRVMFGAVALVTILGVFAPWSNFAEITTHFRVVYAWSAALAALLALPARSWRMLAICGLLLIWQLSGIVPWYAGSVSHARESGTTLRVMTANVYTANPDPQPFLRLVVEERPDVLFIQELSPQWAAAMSTLRGQYPFVVESERRDAWGMGLYSKFPIENAFDDDPVGRDVPMIRADIVVEDRRVHVVNVHIASPEGPTLTGIRLRQFQWLTDYVSSLDGPAIVAGDFNCTMWSPLYKSVARRGKLNNARAGLGIAPTWFHLGGSLYLLPLDHILARGARFTAARAGAGIGSDHRPLIAELSLPAQ